MRVTARAGSRKAVVSALQREGHPVTVQAVGSWVTGQYEPAFSVYCWASERYGVSLDEARGAQPFVESASAQLAELVRRVGDLERTQDWLLGDRLLDPAFAERYGDEIRRREQQRERREATG